jgi:hypothetical protein
MLTVFISACYKELVIFDSFPNEDLELPLILALNDKDCFFDYESNSFRFSIGEDSIENFSPFIEFQEHSSIFIDDVPLTNNAINNLGTIKTQKSYKVSITTLDDTEEFTLRFTTLPILRIVSHNEFKDDPKSLAQITIYAPKYNMDVMSSFVGMELRGASSQVNPKKSYGFTFLRDKNINNKTSKAVFDWAENEDWILDAVYNDQTKFRNKLSFEIWEAMNPSKNASIQSEFVEVYMNNDYLGLYCLNEQMNAEQLGLENSEAVIYKTISWGANTIFESLSSGQPPGYTNLWQGFQQKYPSPSYEIKWDPLYDLRDWAVNDSDQEFIDNASTQVDLENIIDYYIFINLIGAFDNHGKNMFWISPSIGEPFSIIPWDLDASWGRDWDSSPLLPLRITSDDNKLFERLLVLSPDNFTTRLKNRWSNLRTTLATINNINSLLDHQFEQLMKTDVIELENTRWGQGIDLYSERTFIHNWLVEQVGLLDAYFNDL